MNKELKPLFKPWKIGNLKIKNRIVQCPMGGTSIFGWMELHHFDKDSADYFMDIAKNNVGLVVQGIAPIRNPLGGAWLYKSKKSFKKLAEYMTEFHKTGAKYFVQLTAGFGRSFAIPHSMAPMLKNKFLKLLIKPVFNLSYLSAAPSKLPLRWVENQKSREISIKEINEMINAFAKTAKMCKDAGVDGVEVHAVHEGYLLDQFATEYTNKRTDEFGGKLENRLRFATEIVKAIKDACGKDYPVSIRYSAVSKVKDFNDGILPGEKFKELGRNIKESEKVVKILEDAGYDMLNMDNGTYDSWYWAHPPQYMPNNCNLKDVSHIKKFTKLPIVCAGKMDPYTASKAITAGQIDAMGVARQFLVDPEWITKMMEGREDEIMPCIHCQNACIGFSHTTNHGNTAPMGNTFHMSRCALNPQTMDGGKNKIVRAKKCKTIAIIGGGIGGMEAARLAALRGHKPAILEKSNQLGGIFVAASAPSFKEADKRLIEWYKLQMKKLDIDIHLNTEIESLEDIIADEIIVATGSLPKVPKIKGIEKAVLATDYLLGEEVGENVAVIGGGLTGCEVAYNLAINGKKPFIIEKNDCILSIPGLCMANSSYLIDYFKHNDIKIFTNSQVVKITDKKIYIENAEKLTKEIKIDSVINAIGYCENPIFNKKRNVHIVGDAYKVGNLRTVIWRVWEVLQKI